MRLRKIEPHRLVFLDETGAKTNMTRPYARSQKGTRAVDYAPHGHWNTTTLVAAITMETAIAPMVLDGPMDTAAFNAYVEHILIPELPDGAIVVMDNLAAHKSPTTGRLLNSAGASLRYLPAYSPDFNPIEQMWSKVKNHIKSAKARTQEDLDHAIADGLARVTSQDTKAFFQHCYVSILY